MAVVFPEFEAMAKYFEEQAALAEKVKRLEAENANMHREISKLMNIYPLVQLPEPAESIGFPRGVDYVLVYGKSGVYRVWPDAHWDGPLFGPRPDTVEAGRG